MVGKGWRETGDENIWRERVGGKRVAGTYGGKRIGRKILTERVVQFFSMAKMENGYTTFVSHN